MKTLLEKAVQMHQAGNLIEAESLYRECLVVDPLNPDALALLGVLEGIKGHSEIALSLTKEAAERDPSSALLKLHYGNVLMSTHQYGAAIKQFTFAVTLQPALTEAYFNLANALRADGSWVEAIAAYHKVITLNPHYKEAYNNLALSYVHERNYEAAAQFAEEAVRLSPSYGEAWITLCNVYEKQQDYGRARQAAESSIRYSEDNHYAWFGYGVVLNRLDCHEEAIIAYQRALTLNPKRADIWDNLGQTYQSLNRLDEAEETYHKTIEVAGQVIPDENERFVEETEYGNRHWHLALMELLRGNLVSGFARYRSRFREVGGLKRPTLSRPLWRGEPIESKTLLICDEQGFGDTLMMVRYLHHLHKRGVSLILSVHPALRRFFQEWPILSHLMVHGETVPPYDYYCMIFDLPHLLGTSLETIPSTVPYLPEMIVPKEMTLPTTNRPKVGVVWAGNPLHSNDQRRSVPLSQFRVICEVEGLTFYSFNRDLKERDRSILESLPVINLVPQFEDFAGAACLIQQMDLVITCDTSTAHLAAGLGKEVWVLLPYAPDWRWLTSRRDSPWYPTVRLYRQPKANDWQGPILEIQKDLIERFVAHP